jgi:hypothetical protein
MPDRRHHRLIFGPRQVMHTERSPDEPSLVARAAKLKHKNLWFGPLPIQNKPL